MEDHHGEDCDAAQQVEQLIAGLGGSGVQVGQGLLQGFPDP